MKQIINGFFNKELATEHAELNIKNGYKAKVVKGKPISSYLGMLPRWDVIVIY